MFNHFVNSASLLGGTAAIYKGLQGAQVLVFKNGDKSTLIHTETLPSVAKAKAWRANTAQAMIASHKR